MCRGGFLKSMTAKYLDRHVALLLAMTGGAWIATSLRSSR
jgi:hypothetical protein